MTLIIMEKLPQLDCRKCEVKNPIVYYAPVALPNNEGVHEGTCICYNCADERNWIDDMGKVKEGIEL